MDHPLAEAEAQLLADPRWLQGVALFNAAEWYPCHDLLEDLWHGTQGPLRPVLQGILQIAVAHLHLERDNRRGATILLGEGLGRLRDAGPTALAVDLDSLRLATNQRLQALQAGADPSGCPVPRLLPAAGLPSS